MTEQPFSMDVPEFEYAKFLNYGSESDLVDVALSYGRSALPEWQPRAGNTEVVLIESLALMLGVEVMAIQTMPNQVVEQIMGLYGIRRDQGQEAVGRVRFTVTKSNPTQTIPEGTRLRYYIEASGETIDILTVESLTIITSETTTGEVDVYADVAGVAPNGTPIGTNLAVVDALLPFVEFATVSLAIFGGTGVESDNAYFGRAAAALSRLTSTLVSPDSFQYAALQMAGVGRAKVFDLYDPAAPNAITAGHITVAIADPAGEPKQSAFMDDLAQDLEAQALASLVVHVIAPTYTVVNVAVTVRATPGYTETQVRDSVTQVVKAFINPATWDWSSSVTQYALIAILGAAAGVRAVVTAPADVALPGKAPLPRLGALAITVTA